MESCTQTKVSPDWICAIFARLQWKSLVNRDITIHIQSGDNLQVFIEVCGS